MPDLPTTLAVVFAVMAGVTIVRMLNTLIRRLTGHAGRFTFSDLLADDGVVEHRNFLWLALPPLVGGMLLAFWPGTNGGAAGVAGFFAAFLDVWPVYQFPSKLLDEHHQPFWARLKVLSVLFVGMSAAVTYFGFVVVDRILPVDGIMSRARAWYTFLDRLSTNALYGPAKYAIAVLLVLGGIYFNRERVRIAQKAAAMKTRPLP